MKKDNWLLIALLALALALPLGGCSDDDDEDELAGNWVKVSDFDGVARCSAVTFTVDGKVYVAAGGYGGYKYKLNDLWVFNEDSGTWTQKASMEGTARTYAVLLAGRMPVQDGRTLGSTILLTIRGLSVHHLRAVHAARLSAFQ